MPGRSRGLNDSALVGIALRRCWVVPTYRTSASFATTDSQDGLDPGGLSMRFLVCEIWLQAADPALLSALGQIVNLLTRLVICDGCDAGLVAMPQ